MRRIGVGTAILMIALSLSTCGGPAERAASPGCRARASSVEPPDGGYGGALLDTFVGLDDPSLPGLLVCVLAAHGIDHAVLAAPMDPENTFETESAYRSAVEGNEATYLPMFVMPDGSSGEGVDRVVREVGLFFRGVWVDDLTAVASDVVDAVTRRGLFLVGDLPSPPDGLPVVLTTLADHPGAKVIVVASRATAGLTDAVRTQDRLFVSIRAPRAKSATQWLPVVQAAPARVMWGSGVRSRADAEPAAYGRIVSDARMFLARLPQPLRDEVARENAERIFGVSSPPEPDA